MLRLIFLAGGLVVFVWLFVDLGPGAIVEMLGRIGWTAVPIALTYGIYQCLRARALSACVPSARTLRFSDALWIRLSGEAVQFLTFTGPFLAEPAKAWLLKGRGLSAIEGFAATITEYLSYTFTAAFLSIAAISWLLAHDALSGGNRVAGIVIIWIMAAFLISGTVAIYLRIHLLGAILERIAALPLVRRRLKPNMADVHRVEDLLLDVMHDRPGRFASILAMEAASHALHIFELFLILLALELGTGIGTAALIEGASKFIGLAFFFIPGQVGASEGARTIIFEAVGLSAVAGFTVPFVRRIRSIVVAAAGLASMSVLSRSHHEKRP
ncbi:MAG: lysylphosphatidylglycerol synthase domain-containing protein [Vicinamibacterales bacterium]